MSSPNLKVGEYLLRRLKHLGIEHVFGVPGDFALTLNRIIADSGYVKWIGTCGELGAAYAADGYARVKGAGAVVTTYAPIVLISFFGLAIFKTSSFPLETKRYAVGELSALNGVAGAFTEHVPLVVITGAPPRSAYDSQLPLHHTLGDYDIPRQVFEKVTVTNAFLKDPSTAAENIDRVLSSMIRYQRPVYLSVPSDVVCQPTGHSDLLPDFAARANAATDKNTLNESVDRAFDLLSGASRPIILADVEIARYGLEQNLKLLIERSGIPYATLMMGKCVMDERHPQNIGLYMGRSSREYVQQRVEQADLILQLGVVKTDLNSGGFSMDLERTRTICAAGEKVEISFATYHNVCLGDFIDSLSSKFKKAREMESDLKPAREHAFHRPSDSWKPGHNSRLTLNRFFDKIACFIPKDSIIVAETGNALFGAAETLMPDRVKFISQVFYGSIGYTLPAALGASMVRYSLTRWFLPYQIISNSDLSFSRLLRIAQSCFSLEMVHFKSQGKNCHPLFDTVQMLSSF
jgi:TPP-dependent 2-oxoacid decarboxylase